MDIDVDRIIRDTFVADAEYFEVVDSTNNRAADRAAVAGRKLPLLILADRQTAGRGRGANRWWTGRGALAFSLLIEGREVDPQGRRSPLVSLAVGVAVAESLAPLLPNQNIGIKWPNDVLAGGKKLAGILVEVLTDRRHVIGIGINVNNTLADAPDDLKSTAATLRDLAGHEFDRTELLANLLNRLDNEFSRLRRDPDAVSMQAERLRVQ